MSDANKSVGKNFSSTIEHPLVKLRVNFSRRNSRNNMLVNIAMSNNMGVGMFHEESGGSDGESGISGVRRHGVGMGGLSEVGLGGVCGEGTCGVSEEGICGVGVGGASREGIRGVSEEGNNLVKKDINFFQNVIQGSLLGGGPLNSNLPIDPQEPSDRSPPAGASTFKLQFHLLSSSTHLTGMPLLHPQPHQLKIGQPKVVHETGSENEDKSGNRSEAETNEEVEDKIEEEVEGETEEDAKHKSEEVIPIPYKKWSKKKTSSPLTLEFVRSELPVPIVN
ncbi:hypothetical protein ACH5RR_036954 [Cinchona calisaya]|uniref:Uncharacterized protein n=1 Tax=Cinchona calisaya TaxID=153742 RepID=A0ABD2Y6C3_9GENT